MKKRNDLLKQAIGEALSRKYEEELALCEEGAECSPGHYKKMSRILGFRVGATGSRRLKRKWVAAILAAALLLSGCVFSLLRMENTLSFENTYSDNKTAIHNFHKIEDLGGADLTALTGTDMTQRLSGRIGCDIVTTAGNVTYMVVSYMNSSTCQAEFILYRAKNSGWEKVASAPIAVFFTSGAEYKYYSTGEVNLLCDSEDNLYVVSVYEEGIQLHRYTNRGKLVELGKQKIADFRTVEKYPGAENNNWSLSLHATVDESTQSIAVMCVSTFPFLDSANADLSRNELCFVAYDVEAQAFDTPMYLENEHNSYGLGLEADGKGGYYLLLRGKLDTFDSAGKLSGAYLYRLSNGSLSDGLLITGPKERVGALRLLEVDEEGVIHVVYPSRADYWERMIYVKVQDGAVVDTYPIVSSDKRATLDDFISFDCTDGRIYFTEFADNKKILFSCVDGKKTQLLAEFELPAEYEIFYGIQGESSSLVAQGNIVNLIFTDAQLSDDDQPVRELYFAQIVCDYEIPSTD